MFEQLTTSETAEAALQAMMALEVARKGGKAAYELLLGFVLQEREAVEVLTELGVAVPAEESLESVEFLSVPAPLVAQRFDRVRRDLRVVTAGRADEPGESHSG
jgi:hypothetical protein